MKNKELNRCKSCSRYIKKKKGVIEKIKSLFQKCNNSRTYSKVNKK